jgi:indolepyruvate decarboxylase
VSTVAAYLARRLVQYRARHLFGIPGTSCSGFFDAAAAAGMEIILTSNELEAGYAADAYARFAGLAAVCVSYGVGTLSLTNAVAGALVERSPVVLVNGGPSELDEWGERELGVLFSHSTGRPQTDLEVFRLITAAAVRARSAAEAPALIDAAIATALRESRPVYVEIPADLWTAPCGVPSGDLEHGRPATGQEEALAKEIAARIGKASHPAVLVGAEVARYGLASHVAELLETTQLPWATTLLAKSVLSEQTPGFLGVYDSDLAPKPVREAIEGADLLLALGCVLGIDHRALVSKSKDVMVRVQDGFAQVGRGAPVRAELREVVKRLSLASGCVDRPSRAMPAAAGYAKRRLWTQPPASDSETITYEELFECIDRILDESWAVVADTCLGSYPAADLEVVGSSAFIGNPVWLSIGHSVGAAAGVALASGRRPLVICGDGGFQTSAQGLSTLARYRLPALVILIDNGTYAIEQYLIAPKYFQDPAADPLPYVDLNRWDYAALARAMGFPLGFAVEGRGDLELRLQEAVEARVPMLLAVRMSRRALPPENVVA